jgi:hypothetical protein
MIRLAAVVTLVSCSSRVDPPPPTPTPSVVEDTPKPDAAPPPDAAGPTRIHAFRLTLTAPAGWTQGPRDRVLPGLVTLTGPDQTTAMVIMMGVDRKEASDPAKCKDAAGRSTATGVEAVGAPVPKRHLESATIVKDTRYGSACKIVQIEEDTPGYNNGHRVETSIYTIGERDMLTFMCRSAKDNTDACKAIFDSIEPEPR